MAMEEFDVDSFRGKYETVSDWKVKRAFLISNHEYFTNRVLLGTMACCYVNVHCYGCSYPDEVMSRLNELEMNIDKRLIDDYQPNKDNSGKKLLKSKTRKIENEGVSAEKKIRLEESSKASTSQEEYAEIEEKFKKLKKNLPSYIEDKSQLLQLFQVQLDKAKMSAVTNYESLPNGTFSCSLSIDTVFVAKGVATNKKKAKLNVFEKAVEVLRGDRLKVQVKKKEEEEGSEQDGPVELMLVGGVGSVDDDGGGVDDDLSGGSEADMVVVDDGKFSELFKDFVIYASSDDKDAKNILYQSCSFNKVALKVFKKKDKFRILMDEVLVAEAENSFEPVLEVAERLLGRLGGVCYRLQVKELYEADAEFDVAREDLLRDASAGGHGGGHDDDAIPDSNIGSKMLRRMGWSGGGVGRQGNEGIVQPVQLTETLHRQGFGASKDQQHLRQNVTRLLQRYRHTDNQRDLVARGDFTKEERALVHSLCNKVHLKSKWHGRGGDEVLVVSRRRSAQQLLQHVRENGSSKYLLTSPSPLPP